MFRLLTPAAGVLAAALAISVSAAAHAQAKPIDLTTAERVMLTSTQAQSLGVSADAQSTFGRSAASTGTLGEVPLCNSSFFEEIVAPGSSLAIYTAYAPMMGGMAFTSQRMHVYPNASAASKAWQEFRKRGALCSVTYSYAVFDDTVVTTTTNGLGKTGRETWMWIRTEGRGELQPSPQNNSSYTTYRRVGRSIQELGLNISGPGTAGLSDAQRARVRGLTGTLGNAWLKAFG